MKQLVFFLLFLALSAALVSFPKTSLAQVSIPVIVPTFQSLSISWSPPGGSANIASLVNYRPVGTSVWKEALPLWFDAKSSEYRGSIVQLTPATSYEVRLTLQGTAISTTTTATTWSENFPIVKTVYLPSGTTTGPIVVNQSGSPTGYVLYTHPTGASTTITAGERWNDYGFNIQASYVIIRGVTIKGGASSILIRAGYHDIVIEENDMSGWGRFSWRDPANGNVYGQSNGAIENYDETGSDLITRVIIQRNRIHHPKYDTNNWSEYHQGASDNGYHPDGPSGTLLIQTGGNHVIRYNQFDTDDTHYFQDIVPGGHNGSTGFPYRDSDIYGNILEGCWDDGIEADGSARNVRIWGNYINKCYVGISSVGTREGPVYIWRNVFNISEKKPGDYKGGFLKSKGSETTGKRYIFHNTLLNPNNQGPRISYGHGEDVDYFNQHYSRNNILQVSIKPWGDTNLQVSASDTNSLDYDLFNGTLKIDNLADDVNIHGQERHGIRGVPVYNPSPTFNMATGQGIFTLDPTSPGFDAGTRIPNFNDEYTGTAPDMGAHEAGTQAMQFGVNAYLTPTPTPTPTPIDIKDILAAYATSQADFDMNNDGKVNSLDFAVSVR